jgi:hypothetical protein
LTRELCLLSARFSLPPALCTYCPGQRDQGVNEPYLRDKVGGLCTYSADHVHGNQRLAPGSPRMNPYKVVVLLFNGIGHDSFIDKNRSDIIHGSQQNRSDSVSSDFLTDRGRLLPMNKMSCFVSCINTILMRILPWHLLLDSSSLSR